MTRKSSSDGIIRNLWNDFRSEISLLMALLAVAIILFSPRLSGTLLGLGHRIWTWLVGASSAALRMIDQVAGHITLAQFIGAIAVVTVGAAVIARLRWRLSTHPALSRLVCPVCGSRLHRIHRRRRDRVLSLLVPVRRYRCANDECGWEGLRYGRSRRRSDHQR
ncbi:MAG: hypothetical protein Kow0047_16770 [Anaerolineae bacterium]